MGETNYHLKDDFFEEILNGIPESEEKRQEYLKNIEKNSKTSLSPDNKTRLKRVAASFLSTEESKKAFIELIKNAKKREQNSFLKDIKKSIFLSKIENDEGVEEKISEDIKKEENKSGGLFSKVNDLRKKYKDVKGHFTTARRVLTLINLIKGTYMTLSNLTVNDAFKSKNKVIRNMNKITNDFLDGNIGGLFHAVILPSVSTSLGAVIEDIKVRIDKALSKFNLYLYEAVSVAMTAFVSIAMIAAAGSGALAAGASKATALEMASWANVIQSTIMDASNGGDMSMRRIFDIIIKTTGNKALSYVNLAEKIWSGAVAVWDAREKIADVYKYTKMGVKGIFGHYGESQEELNLRLQKVGESLNAKGDEIISNITNGNKSSFSDNLQLASRITHDVFEEGSLLFRQEYRDLENKIIYDVDKITTTQDKFNFVYGVISNSYFKDVEMSPWSKSIRYISEMVKYLHNSFIDVYEPLDEMVNNQSYFYNSKGEIIDLNKYISDIIDMFSNGVTARSQSGRILNFKLKRHQRKELIKKSFNKEEDKKYFKINIHTKQSIKKKFKIYKDNKTKSELLSYTNAYKPHVKIVNPENKKLNFISDFRVINPSSKIINEQIVSPQLSTYDFESIGTGTNFFKEINKTNISLKSKRLMELFEGCSITSSMPLITYYDENFNGNYHDNNYMEYHKFQGYMEEEKYFGVLGWRGRWNEGGEDSIIYYDKLDNNNPNNLIFNVGMDENENAISLFKARYQMKLNGNGKIRFMTLMDSELLMENYINSRFNQMTNNYKSFIEILDKTKNELTTLDQNG